MPLTLHLVIKVGEMNLKENPIQIKNPRKEETVRLWKNSNATCAFSSGASSCRIVAAFTAKNAIETLKELATSIGHASCVVSLDRRASTWEIKTS